MYKKIKRWYLDECVLRGHGLFECENSGQAGELKRYLDGIVHFPFTSCIVREKEINVYSVRMDCSFWE